MFEAAAANVKRLLLAVVLLSGSIARASAQGPAPPVEDVAAPEVFGHIGVFGVGSDEGRIGTGASYGGLVTVPLKKRVAFEVDVQTGSVERTNTFLTEEDSYQTRRTLVIPSLLYRFGDEELYYFVGGGVGAEFWTETYRRQGLPPPDRAPPGVQFTPGALGLNQYSGVKSKISFRVGFARFFTRRLGLRGDAFIAGWHLGARIGIGYRFD